MGRGARGGGRALRPDQRPRAGVRRSAGAPPRAARRDPARPAAGRSRWSRRRSGCRAPRSATRRRRPRSGSTPARSSSACSGWTDGEVDALHERGRRASQERVAKRGRTEVRERGRRAATPGSGAARGACLAPVLTPFGKDLAPDAAAVRAPLPLAARATGARRSRRSGRRARRTRSRSTSGSRSSTRSSSEGVPADRLMPGTGCCALPDSVRLTAHAVRRGCAGVLMLPPFYYKGVTGRRALPRVRRGDRAGRRRSTEGVPVPHPAGRPGRARAEARRAAAAGLPAAVAGMKDSSGDFANTRTMLERVREGRLRRLRRERAVPPREPARRRGRLHHRDRERERGRDRAALRGLALPGGRPAAGGA